MLSSTGVKLSTSASESQPSNNTKKDRIHQPPSSTQKNKVEAHPRTVKSSLKIKNYVVEPKETAIVQHFKLNMNSKLICVKCNVCMLSDNHDLRVINVINDVIARPKSKSVKITSKRKVWKPAGKVFTKTGYTWRPTGVDLFTGSQGNNLYTLSLGDMMASSPICLLSKALKTKSWLWHRRLSHLNFGALNHLARHGLARGLPKLKFKKDHLCSACAMGKRKKKPHKPKSEDTNQRILYLLHMDLCDLMHVKSVNGKNVDPPAPEVIALIAKVVALEPTASTVISNDVEEENHDLNVSLMNNDPFFGISIPENVSDASSSLDVIPTVVHTAAPNSEHVNNWTKDHPLENIIGELGTPVST
uniref:Retrovirus-related Pol polyprotein from transposon TNT 1-94 n=1 Tax=Tanacetum cinerariifolium TaxID=118510 RepID=A0A699GJ55_TANCI|nr:retrovirus-related Pol polyprotein from transposon TNT 1-94 [Tanacetum cinerariifolium]